MRRRLDVEMVRRGIATSRAEAGMAIRSGRVTVGGRPAVKASTLVLPDEPILLAGPARRFVSRGGEKLQAALERFGVDVTGRVALDAGASTGGFTQCLLEAGAEAVIAVDVGYGQLDWRLREDPRVTALERVNVRTLRSEMLPRTPDLLTADLSFISLALVLPALVGVGGPGAEFVLLVKPQFEAGRAEVGRGGVVRDPEAWRRAVETVAEACVRSGVSPLGVMASPLLGPAGNAEFLLYALRRPEPAGLDPAAVDVAIAEARRLLSGRSGHEGAGDLDA